MWSRTGGQLECMTFIRLRTGRIDRGQLLGAVCDSCDSCGRHTLSLIDGSRRLDQQTQASYQHIVPYNAPSSHSVTLANSPYHTTARSIDRPAPYPSIHHATTIRHLPQPCMCRLYPSHRQPTSVRRSCTLTYTTTPSHIVRSFSSAACVVLR